MDATNLSASAFVPEMFNPTSQPCSIAGHVSAFGERLMRFGVHQLTVDAVEGGESGQMPSASANLAHQIRIMPN